MRGVDARRTKDVGFHKGLCGSGKTNRERITCLADDWAGNIAEVLALHKSIHKLDMRLRLREVTSVILQYNIAQLRPRIGQARSCSTLR